MKSKTKKFLVVACLGLIGMGCLTGCTMNDEQKNALNVLTNNTETLVESFDSYLEGQNNKLDKEVAYDMLKHARIKSSYILNESSICNLVVEMEDGLSQQSLMKMDAIYDFSSNIKKMMVSYIEDDTDIRIAYCDLNNQENSYEASYINNQPVVSQLNNTWYATNLNPNIDALAQAGIQNIELEDVTRVTVNELGEYTFNVVKTTIFKQNEEYFQVVNFAKIIVKDYLFKSVEVQNITKVGNENSFSKNLNNENIDDGYGSYVFSGTITSLINIKAEYKYGNDVILTDMNSRILDINDKIANGDISLN